MSDKIYMEKQKGMDNQDSFLPFGIVLFLIAMLFCNIGGFFFFKNSARDLRMAIARIDADIVEENRRLSVVQADFSKKYSVQYLQELAQNRLNLKFSTVNQVKDFSDIVSTNG